MKKFKLLSLLLVVVLLAGCGNKTASVEDNSGSQVTSIDDSSQTSEASDEDNKDIEAGSDSETGKDAAADDKTGDNEGSDSSQVTRPDELTEVPLTDEEMASFTEFIQSGENYGFLLSVYTDIENADLNQVLYSGANISTVPTDEDVNAYLSAVGAEELLCELVAVPADKLEDFVLEKTDRPYSQMNEKLEHWTYVESTDCYYHEVSDANYEPYTVVSGYKIDDGIVVLRIRNDYRELYADATGYYYPDKEVTLKKVSDRYCFVSCINLLGENVISKWVKDVDMSGYGKCQLRPYDPIVDNHDVTFLIVKDGAIIASLFWESYDNFITDMEFNDIVDIGVSDYNKDGLADIVMSIKYTTFTGEDLYQLRVYSDSGEGYFLRDEEKALACYAAVSNDTFVEDIRADVMFDLLTMEFGEN